jgi:hypothetical protein
VYEAGEAQRFDREAIEVGERGVLAVLAKLGLAQESAPELPRAAGAPSEPFEARSSRWVRARRAGILHLDARLGDAVSAGVRLGVITDPLGRHRLAVRAPADGLLIGLATNPLVHRGDAIAHMALR